jgi:uncharacterized protein YgiM (DUF1202 family)
MPQSGMVNTPILNIRSGPGKNFQIIGKLKQNALIKIIESNGEWDKIGPSRWVNANYIVIIND